MQALNTLKDSRAVVSRPNHGYFLNGAPDDLLASSEEVPPSAEEELYLAVIDARLAGQINETVTQAEVMEYFDAPRNLVEKVLARLAEEGLMARRPGRGWRFLPAFDSSRSWQNGYQLRLVLEPASILLPQFKVDHERLTPFAPQPYGFAEERQGRD